MSLDAECHTHLRILVPPRPWLQQFTPPTIPTYSSHHQSIQNPEPLSARQDMNRHTCPKSNWWCYPIIGIADHFRFLSNYLRKNLQIKRRSNFTPYFTVNFSFTLFWKKPWSPFLESIPAIAATNHGYFWITTLAKRGIPLPWRPDLFLRRYCAHNSLYKYFTSGLPCWHNVVV